MRSFLDDDGADPAGLVRGAPIPWTNAVCGVLVGTHLFTGLYGLLVLRVPAWTAWCGARGVPFRIHVGSQFRPAVLHGDVWRLFTGMFLHVDALHLLLNVVAARSLGQVLEPWVGGRRLVGWFLLCGGLAAVSTHLAGIRQSDGASGAVFGWLGATLVIAWRRRRRMGSDDQWVLGPVLWSLAAINIVLSIALPFVNVVAHVVGLLTGGLLGALWPWRVSR